jgi:hypothetical protein
MLRVNVFDRRENFKRLVRGLSGWGWSCNCEHIGGWVGFFSKGSHRDGCDESSRLLVDQYLKGEEGRCRESCPSRPGV